jgi:hypothetical protein
MAFLTELDVVNECLKTLGELPLNTLDDEHDLVPVAQAALKRANMREQAKAWWFNKELTTLTPDGVTGYITLPGDTIRVDPTDETLNYVQRGARLYQPFASQATDKYKFTKPVDCWLIRLVPFEDLPPMAQNLVSISAVLDFQKDYDADQQKVSDLRADYKMAYIELNAEHIRNVNANRLRSPSFVRTFSRLVPTFVGSGRYA